MLTSSRLYLKEFTFDKGSCIKHTIYQKLHNSNENTFSLIPDVCYFSYLPWIAESLLTLFSTKCGGGNRHNKNINIPLPFCLSSTTPPLPSVKTIKNLSWIRRFKHERNVHWLRALYFPCAYAPNSQYLVS